ncbi:hypothetical protein GCM10020001_045150 [Nonomuraea salmonea]
MDGQRRLADPADAGDCRHRHALGRRLGRQHRAQAYRDLLAAGEVADGGGQLGGSRQIERGGLLVVGGRRLLLLVLLGPMRGGERGVGGEYALVQRRQLGPWLDAQLVDERLAGLGEDVERVALPAAAVVGEHELGAQALAQRVLGGQRDQLGDDLGVLAQLQVDVHEGLDDADAPLDQAVALVLGVRADGAGQRLALEQGQRGAQLAGRLGEPAGLARGLGLGDAAFEAGQVERVVRQAQRVAAADRGEQLGAGAGGPARFEHRTQARDVRAQGPERARRRLLAPDGVDHLVGG